MKFRSKMSGVALRVEFLPEDSWLKAVSVARPTEVSVLKPNKVRKALGQNLAARPEQTQGAAQFLRLCSYATLSRILNKRKTCQSILRDSMLQPANSRI
jgi:hypothetical protein